MSLHCEGDVGAVCDLDGCDVFDFLPWHCGDCGGRYCTAHKAAADHQCYVDVEADTVEENSHNANANDCGDNKVGLKATSSAAPSPPPRGPVECGVCGNDDCLLHQMHPEIVEKIAEERRAALARRVWGPNGRGTTKTNPSTPLPLSSCALPWRIGKLTAKQNSGNTCSTAVTSAAAAAAADVAPRDGDGARLTKSAMAASGHTVQIVGIHIAGGRTCPSTSAVSGDNAKVQEEMEVSPDNKQKCVASVLFKKATVSHGVSVGFAADALASLIAAEVAALAASECPSASSSAALTQTKAKERPAASLYLLASATKCPSSSSFSPSPFALRPISGVDGGSAYLIDHLTRRDNYYGNTDEGTTDAEATTASSRRADAGGGVDRERLLFCIVEDGGAASVGGGGRAMHEAVAGAVCAELVSKPTAAAAFAARAAKGKGFSDTFSPNPSAAVAGWSLSFPQFFSGTRDEEETPMGKRPRDGAEAGQAGYVPPPSAASIAAIPLSDRLVWQQVATMVRMLQQQGSKGEPTHNAAEGTAPSAANEKPQDAASPPTDVSPPPSQSARFAGITLYKDASKPVFGGGGGGASSGAGAAVPPSSWGFAELAVAHPRAAPINAKEGPKIGTADSRCTVAVQLLPLRSVPAASAAAVAATTNGGAGAGAGESAPSSSPPPPRRHQPLPSARAKAFCVIVDAKWSIGRLVERLRADAGIGGAVVGATTVWSLVSIEIEGSGGGGAGVHANSAATSTPSPFTLRVLSADLSAVGGAVGLRNGSLLLLVENEAASPSSMDTTVAGAAPSVRLPQSLVPFVEAAFIGAPSSAGNTASAKTAPARLQPKNEAKMRKDCVVQ